MGFAKLSDTLVFSSILREEDGVFKVFFLILSQARANGIAPISADFIGSVTRKDDAEVERCLRVLEAPDPKSKSLNDEGRRIRRVDGGFEVINYLKYRQDAEAESVREYERERKRRQREAVPDMSGNVPGRSASASASASVVVVGGGTGEGPLPLPPERRAEEAIKDHLRTLQCRLGEWICKLSEHPNSRLMVPAWTQRVSSYERPDGSKARGEMDYRNIHRPERLEKCIADAEWWWAELEGGRIVS